MRFRVNGLPAPQGSKRLLPAGGKRGGRLLVVESSRAVGPWREAVRAEAQRAYDEWHDGGLIKLTTPNARYLGPVSVAVTFVLPRPKGHFGTGRNAGTVRSSAPRFPAGRPDVDKLVRATLDGLVMGGVMADDAQVCKLDVAKVFAAEGEAVGAIFDVEAMT